MRRAFSIVAVLFVCSWITMPGMAQELVPVIHLSAEETAKTKKAAQALIHAQERNSRAQLAWEQFYKLYDATHTDMRDLRFTEDCRFAVGATNSRAPFLTEITTVELTPEDRQKLTSISRELADSKEANKEAMKNWEDYENQFLADHVGTATSNDETGGAVMVGGKHVPIPQPWSNGVAFTPDFRMAVPR